MGVKGRGRASSCPGTSSGSGGLSGSKTSLGSTVKVGQPGEYAPWEASRCSQQPNADKDEFASEDASLSSLFGAA
eukprot:6434326-Pyramimonas_sp.AAC.1